MSYSFLSALLESAGTRKERMPDPEFPVPSAVRTVEEVEATIKKVHAFNERRWKDIIRRSEELNQGLSPIVDAQGRYHAPKDGYVHPENDVIYRGGSYLPFPEEYYEKDGELRFRGGRFSGAKDWRYQERVRMPLTAANDLKTMGQELLQKDNALYAGYFDIGTGKSWTEGGIEVCYAYIKAAYKPIFEAILRFASNNEHKRPEKEAITYPEWSAGRRKITGEVVSIKAYESMYGTSWKMLVAADDGNKAFGGMPSGIDIQRGDRIEFFAAVEQKEPGFYYFKRPTKAKIVG